MRKSDAKLRIIGLTAKFSVDYFASFSDYEMIPACRTAAGAQLTINSDTGAGICLM